MCPHNRAAADEPVSVAGGFVQPLVRQLSLNSEKQCAEAARRFAAAIPKPVTAPLHIHLQGGLGAGKTFWAREMIAALVGEGERKATSPTFAWALSYPANDFMIYHMDLFRLPLLPGGTPPPDELMEMLSEPALCLIEWAERSTLPPPDVLLTFAFANDETQQRLLTIQDSGQSWARGF